MGLQPGNYGFLLAIIHFFHYLFQREVHRQLIAQAIAEEIPVVTPDVSFDLYPVKVIW